MEQPMDALYSDEELELYYSARERSPNTDILATLGLDKILEADDFVESLGKNKRQVIGALTQNLERCHDCPTCERWAASGHGDACEHPIYDDLKQRRRGRPEHNPADSYARGLIVYRLDREIEREKERLQTFRRRVTDKEAFGILAERIWPGEPGDQDLIRRLKFQFRKWRLYHKDSSSI